MQRLPLRQLNTNSIRKGIRKVKNTKSRGKKKVTFEDPVVLPRYNNLPNPKLKCEYIELKEEENENIHDFKLYKEKDLPFLKDKVMDVELSDMACDNDCQTENEQIESSIRSTNEILLWGIDSYQKDQLEVRNFKKYEKDRVPMLKRHRIY